MGSMKEMFNGRVRLLESEHLVGRGPSCALCINERYVSAQHATMRFTGERWEIRDLGSRNGTFLDGVRIKPGEEFPLRQGAKIAFGKIEQEWELIDESPPWVMAVPLDGGDPTQLDGDLLALPSSEDPRVTIYRNADGAWVLEQPESVSPITNLQTFEIDGRAFRFSCPESISKTSLADSSLELEVRHLTLLFSVSQDEEHVQLQATYGTSTFDLGARSHNYLLLTLARKRLEDGAEGLPETTCGWIYLEDLAHDPSMAPPQLNIDVFRIRKQFAALGVIDAANIIERRPRTRQLRIGVSRLSVVSL
jgi:FHA domain